MKKQVLFIVLMLMPLMASASTKINGIYYNLNSTTTVAEVTSVPNGTAEYSNSVVIPKTVSYGGRTYSVTSIGRSAFSGCSGLTSVTIPTSVTSIGESAFSGCSSLTSVTIPSSVTSIGWGAFSDCSSLTSVTIPNSVTSIGGYAFSGCNELTSVHITDLVAWCKIDFDFYYYNDYDNNWLEVESNPLVYAHHLYLNGTEIKNLVIPNSITSIRAGSFSGCTGLTSVTIPNSVTSIGAGSFSDCTGLTSVTIPNSVTSIGDKAFSGCSSLTSVSIPSSVKSIGEDAFGSVSSVYITDLAAWCNIDFSYWYVYEGYEEVYCFRKDGYAFSNNNHLFLNGLELKDLVIPNGVTEIKEGAFFCCKGLTSVTIPNSVNDIGHYAFNGCTSIEKIALNCQYVGDWFDSSIKEVIIGNEVKSIESSAFSGSTSIEKVTFHSQEIGDWFGGSIKEVIIGDEVISIGSNAFSGCSGLTSITIPNSVTSIGSNAFSGCSGLTSITIPNSVTSIGNGVFSGCTSLPIVNNCRYADTYLVEAVDKTITSCSIREVTRFIGENAFSGCSGLTSVIIPNSVTSIGSDAFSGCSNLQSVNISDIAAWCNISFSNNPLSYAHHLFMNGEEVKDLVIPNSVTSIGSSTFSGCLGLISVTIPNSVTSIGVNAFQGCSDLSSVSIGKGIKSIGSKAFANCPNIKKVYCYAKDVPTISNDTFENSYYIKWATLYVPESSVDLYKASAWSQFGNIVGITGGNEGERCAKPVITLLANGKIKVESATEGATCVTNITASNAEPLSDGEIRLNTPLTVYTVTSYATKEGYNDSEVTTATFRYEKVEGDMNGDGMLNITDVIHLVNMILGQ